MAVQHVLILGCGYVGQRLARACLAQQMRVTAVRRSPIAVAALRTDGVEAVAADSPSALPDVLLASVDLLVDSIPLTRHGDQLLASQPDWLPALVKRMPRLQWAGYLSSTSVYGDAGGAWVDESHHCQPSSVRGVERLKAESAWLGVTTENPDLQVELFRLAGIYGPARNLVARLRAGGYKVVDWQPPHWSNRIHVDDIVAALLAAMRQPQHLRITNLTDDHPLPHADYVIRLAAMIDAPPPQLLTPAEGERLLSSAVLDFFRDNKRLRNSVLHRELLSKLRYPSFETALETLLADVPGE